MEPEKRSSIQLASAYPNVEQYERWKTRAKELDMDVSEFIQAMIEAGLENFDVEVEPDETNRELPQQRNALKAELDHKRERIQWLEDQLHGELHTIRENVEANPGTEFAEIVQHLIDTVPQRVNTHLDELEGKTIRVEMYIPTV